MKELGRKCKCVSGKVTVIVGVLAGLINMCIESKKM
jgi:hypothetical protein